MGIDEYFRKRRIAIIITLMILMIGSVVYFSTGVAERNNEMMYKEIYGEDIVLMEKDNITGSSVPGIPVDESTRIPGKQTLA